MSYAVVVSGYSAAVYAPFASYAAATDGGHSFAVVEVGTPVVVGGFIYDEDSGAFLYDEATGAMITA